MLEVKRQKWEDGRGPVRGDFSDGNGNVCSIQESSAAGDGMIWLGMDHGRHFEGNCLARMHLTRDHVRDLLPWLTLFAETGQLRK